MLSDASRSIAITDMFNTHHARTALGVIESQPVRLRAGYGCP
jgi:hypothetical protein